MRDTAVETVSLFPRQKQQAVGLGLVCADKQFVHNVTRNNTVVCRLLITMCKA